MRRKNSAHFSVLSECWCCALRWETERNKYPQNMSLVLDVMSWRHLWGIWIEVKMTDWLHGYGAQRSGVNTRFRRLRWLSVKESTC